MPFYVLLLLFKSVVQLFLHVSLLLIIISSVVG